MNRDKLSLNSISGVSTATHQSVLISTRTLSPLSKVTTMWQIDGIAHKLKPRSFHKFTHLWVHSTDFHSSMNHAWHKARELNIQTNIKTKTGKKLWLQALVNSSCTHTGINKQLVKEEKIKTEPMNRLSKVFNTNGTKNGEVTWFIPLEVKIDGYKE